MSEYDVSSVESERSEIEKKQQEVQRLAIRENAKHVLRESGLAEMLIAINQNLLKGRGSFEEYDSLVLFRWGTASTKRHIWVEVVGSSLRFRLLEHRKCASSAPLCDGEYHTFTQSMWRDRALLSAEVHKYYNRPVAETSMD